jgi:O-antigen/teichoic acid export membrane protein
MAVVARLLTPEDFGIIAVATSLIALLDAFTDVGADIALIRHPNPLRHHYDTVWTFNVIVHSVSAAAIALSAVYVTRFYADPRYEMVLYMMSASMLMSGFSNIGIVDFRRTLAFNKDFQITVFVQVIGVVAVIGLAFWLRSYWALVISGLMRTLARVLLSFMMHPFRPRLSLSARREMFGFSFWLMVRSVAIFLTSRADRLVLAAFFSPNILGLYTIASELASIAVLEIIYPINRALMPALAMKQDNHEWLQRSLRKIFNITASLAVAAGVGLAAIAEPALNLVYGSSYTEAAPMLVSLALLNVISGFTQPVAQYLVVIGRVRDFALLYIMEGVATVSVVYALSAGGNDIQMVIYGRLAIGSLAFLRLFYLIWLIKGLTWSEMITSWIRPIIAGAGMYAVLHYSQQLVVGLLPVVLVLSACAAGGVVFSFVALCMWYAMRKPPGIESEILERLWSRPSGQVS